MKDTIRSRIYTPNIGARRIRVDSLPDDKLAGDGCEVALHCVECPLPVCRHDGGGLRKVRNAVRDAEMVRLKEAGMGADALAARFGLTQRSVWRVLKERRDARVAA